MRTTSWASILLVAAVIGGLSAATWARQNRQNKQNKKQDKATASDVDAARKRVADARKALAGAQGDMAKARTGARDAFEKSPELTDALEAVKAARKTYETAREPVMKALADKPAYKAAVEAKDAAEKKKDDALRDGATPLEQRQQVLMAVMDAASAVGKMEKEAEDANPDCAKARKSLDEAIAKLTALRSGFETKLADDAGVVAARQSVQSAEKSLRDAEKDHAEAARRYDAQKAAELREAQRRNDEARRRNHPNNGINVNNIKKGAQLQLRLGG